MTTEEILNILEFIQKSAGSDTAHFIVYADGSGHFAAGYTEDFPRKTSCYFNHVSSVKLTTVETEILESDSSSLILPSEN
jgi:hypothetical protein